MKNLLTCLIATAVCLSPWAIGGNYPFARTVLLAAAALILAGLAVYLLLPKAKSTKLSSDGTSASTRLPKVIWILILGVGYTVFQSSCISHVLEPKTGLDERISDVASNEVVSPLQPSISVYPPATRKRLVDLLLPTGFFILAAILISDRRDIFGVMAAITAVGVCLSGFGVVQKLTFDGKIYGVYELLFGGDPFGPFVNGNNAAGFLLITFSASIFFVARQLFGWNRTQKKKQRSGDGLLSGMGYGHDSEEKESLFSSLIETMAILESKHLYFLAVVALIVAGILMTLSRGGMVSFFVLLVVVFSLIGKTNWKASLGISIVLMVAGISLVTYLDRSEVVSSEIESLADLSSAAEVRLLHWNDALPFGAENFIWGAGNGTYRYVSQSFQTFFYPRVFAHAESVYIETFVEMGTIGLVLLVLVLFLMAHYSIVLLRRDGDFDRALGIAGLGCLAGQATSACLDFGIYQAPNSIAMAVVMGIIAGRACRKPSLGLKNKVAAKTTMVDSTGFALGTRLCLVLLMLAATLWAIYESYGIESKRLASRKITFFDRMNKRPNTPVPPTLDFAEVESLLETSRSIRPDDSNVYASLGELKIIQARSLATQSTKEKLAEQIVEIEKEIEKLEADSPDDETLVELKAILAQLQAITPSVLWSDSAPTAFHQRLRRAQRKSGDAEKDLFEPEEVSELLSNAYQQFHVAERLCPLITRSQLRLAQLAAFATLDSESNTRISKKDSLAKESKHISTALSRSFVDTQLLYNCGFLALNSGDQELAVELWAKCLRYPHFKVHEKAIVQLCIQEMPMNLFFEEILPQNPQDLIRIATKYFKRPELMLPKRILLTHAVKRINATSEFAPRERHLLLAEAAVLNQDYPVAIEHYQSALKMNSKKAPWRLTYCRALYEVQDFDEAMRQLKICQLDSDIRQNQVRALIAKIRRNR